MSSGTGIERAGFCEPCGRLWTWQSKTLTTSRAGCPECGYQLAGRNAARGRVHDVAHRVPVELGRQHMGARRRIVSVAALDGAEPGKRAQPWRLVKDCGHRETTPARQRPRVGSVRACLECPAGLPNNLRKQA